jgi:hypothetical protein
MTKPATTPAPVFSVATARQTDGELMAAANRLAAYEVYLAQARVYKSSLTDPVASRAFDRSVLAQARQANSDVWTVAGQALSVTRALSRVGRARATMQSWFDEVHDAGALRAVDLWTSKAQDGMVQRGATAELVSAISQALNTCDVRASTERPGVLLELNVNGATRKGHLAPEPLLSTPSGIVSQMTRGRTDQLVEMVARQEAAYLLGLPPFDGTARLEDAVAASAMSATKDAVRHVRKLEDAGLATYTGASPALITGLVIAGIVLFALGIAGAAVFCPGQSHTDKELCAASGALAGLGILVILGALIGNAGVPEEIRERGKMVLGSSQDGLTAGGVVIHGVLLHPDQSP